MPEWLKKKKWMTENILDLMEERRRYTNVNELIYMEVHTTIRREITKVKEKFFLEKCVEYEMLNKIHDSLKMYKIIKKMIGSIKENTIGIIRDDGTMITDT